MKNHNTYFAASNGYHGFRSYFDKIFSPKRLNKLYILKGGPGTGKSTLMKDIAERFTDSAIITSIRCSSDPASYDGVLIENGGAAIGIVDGTSPHVVEPVYPGVVEEIINLGDGFDISGLSKKKEAVTELNELKKQAYKNAYFALSTAGGINEYITNVFINNDIYKQAEGLLVELTETCPNCKETVKYSNFRRSAFCKNGYFSLGFADVKKRIISVNGDGISEFAVMDALRKILSDSSVNMTLFSSPLQDKYIDAIETDTTVYCVTSSAEASIRSSEIMPATAGYISALDSYKTFLNEAKRSFAEAASYHSDLEKIYTKNMHFDMNDVKKRKIIDEIEAILKNNHE